MDKQKIIFLLFAAVAVVISCPAFAGTIDPLNNDSQYAYGENVGWFNFEPSFGPGVTVMDTTVTGFIWQENVGWINLGPMLYGGVVNDGNFNLSGWAWGENVGWISFSCANTDTCAEVDYKVTIDCNGNFNGWAWGENIGWIAFNSASPPESPVPFKVQTAWYCLKIDSLTDTQVELSWTGTSNNVAGYIIELAPDNGGSPGAWNLRIDVNDSAASSYAINNLSPCTKFWFHLIAYNTAGEYSAYSNIVSATTDCPSSTTSTTGGDETTTTATPTTSTSVVTTTTAYPPYCGNGEDIEATGAGTSIVNGLYHNTNTIVNGCYLFKNDNDISLQFNNNPGQWEFIDQYNNVYYFAPCLNPTCGEWRVGDKGVDPVPTVAWVIPSSTTVPSTSIITTTVPIPTTTTTTVQSTTTVQQTTTTTSIVPTTTTTVRPTTTTIRPTTTTTTCTYSISPTSKTFKAAGGAGSFRVKTQRRCKWTPTITAGWITSHSSGTGSGSVNYFVAPNKSTRRRTGDIIIDGARFTVTQLGK